MSMRFINASIAWNRVSGTLGASARLEKRMDERFAAVDRTISKLDVRSEIDELKARVEQLQRRIELLEAEL